MPPASSGLSPANLLAEISKGVFRPAYYFYGTEDYRIVEAEKYLVKSFLPENQRTTNYRKLNGRKAPGPEVLAELASIPMLGERSVIAVTDIQSYRPTDTERIVRMLTPPEMTRLVIFSTPSARTPKWNSAFMNQMQKSVACVEFKRLDERESRTAIQAKLGRMKLSIEDDALPLLLALTDGNRGGIEMELDKLRDYVSGDTIRAVDVRTIGSGYQTFEVFEIANSALSGDSQGGLRHLDYLLKGGETPSSIAYFLGIDLLHLYLLQNHKPIPGNQVWRAKKMQRYTGRISNQALENLLLTVAATSAELRHTPPNPELVVQWLVLNIVSQLKPTRRTA